MDFRSAGVSSDLHLNCHSIHASTNTSIICYHAQVDEMLHQLL